MLCEGSAIEDCHRIEVGERSQSERMIRIGGGRRLQIVQIEGSVEISEEGRGVPADGGAPRMRLCRRLPKRNRTAKISVRQLRGGEAGHRRVQDLRIRVMLDEPERMTGAPGAVLLTARAIAALEIRHQLEA